jgi:hypothetical protein
MEFEKFESLAHEQEEGTEGKGFESQKLNISRRDFLKLTGALVLVAGLSASPFGKVLQAFAEESTAPEEEERGPGFDEVAQSYKAGTNREAMEVSNSLLFRNDASPSNICGPLAMAILMQWKLNEDGSISKRTGTNADPYRVEGTIPPEMWLGTPTNDPARYRIAFPPQEYRRYHVQQSIGVLDFDNIPGAGSLQPGDFLYLDGGSFTHYIAVSKKDQQGRVYCVSNLHSNEKSGEFVIDEVVLWDPAKKDGYLRSWARGVGADNASTGTAGFYLWRREKQAEDQSMDPMLEKYRDRFLNMMREQKQGEWNIQVHEIGRGELFEWRKNVPYHAASTIKVPLSVLTLQRIADDYREELAQSDLASVLSRYGTGGRTFDQLISAMLVRSEESATEILGEYCKKGMNVTEGLKSLGMYESMYEPRRTTQKDMFNFWKNLVGGDLVTQKEREYLLEKLNEYTPNDDLYLGRIKETFPNTIQWNKRGVIVDSIMTIQDTGVIQIGEGSNKRTFYVGIAGTSKPGKEISYEGGVEYIDKVVDLLVGYLKEDPLLSKSVSMASSKRYSRRSNIGAR